METRYIVYLHKNKFNNKVYVGITHYINNPNKRWVNGKGYKNNPILNKAILKYGWNNFNHIIIGETSKSIACKIEQSLIKYYKQNNLSYNIGLGGEGTESFSEETKQKLRKYSPWIKGKSHTKEAKRKISEAGKRPCSEETKIKIGNSNRGSNNGMFGKHISELNKLKIKQRFSKPVLQLDMNNNIIREFSSATEAEHYLKVKGSHISCCCTGRRKTAYGYKWRYKNE